MKVSLLVATFSCKLIFPAALWYLLVFPFKWKLPFFVEESSYVSLELYYEDTRIKEVSYEIKL